MKATPGPWERAYGGYDDVELKSRDDFLRFCGDCWDKTTDRGKHLHCVYAKNERGEQVIVTIVGNGPKGEANARLIAAAPDLLEACKKAKQFILNGVELGYIRLSDKPDPALDTLPAICAAIAKAEVQG